MYSIRQKKAGVGEGTLQPSPRRPSGTQLSLVLPLGNVRDLLFPVQHFVPKRKYTTKAGPAAERTSAARLWCRGRWGGIEWGRAPFIGANVGKFYRKIPCVDFLLKCLHFEPVLP